LKLIIALLAIPFSVWSSALGPGFSITSPVVEAPEEEVTPNSIVDTSNEGVVSIGDMADKSKSFGSRPWQAPNYADQKNILGYDSNTFQIPVGLEKQVKFWVDIFSKYTTEQGVLYDSRYIDVVYREIDFNQIPGFTKMSPVAQNRAKKNEVKRLRKEVEEQLKRLANEKDESKLSEADLKVWKAFASIQEPNKFKEASARGRLRFQLGLKDRFVQGIYYSGRYLEEMERIFQEAGLPEEHREKLVSMMAKKVRHNMAVDHIFIHPKPQNYEMFFMDHFSLNPSILARITKIGFKSALSVLRQYDL
jgi:hypothetical protein